MRRPAHVERARLTNDTEALSAMGKAGARAKAENAEKAAIESEMLEVKRAEEAEADAPRRLEETREDIAPLD